MHQSICTVCKEVISTLSITFLSLLNTLYVVFTVTLEPDFVPIFYVRGLAKKGIVIANGILYK
jgi:hypothetical protein